MKLLDHPSCERPGLKVVCDVCGTLSIKPIDPAGSEDDASIHCKRCDAVRGTVADLRDLARRSTGDFEF